MASLFSRDRDLMKLLQSEPQRWEGKKKQKKKKRVKNKFRD